jgi:hypothetical protein
LGAKIGQIKNEAPFLPFWMLNINI